MLTHYEDFLGKLAENMQARCANSVQRDLFSVSLIFIIILYEKFTYNKSETVANNTIAEGNQEVEPDA